MASCSLRMIIRNHFLESTVSVNPAPLGAYPATNMLMTWRSRRMRTSGTTNQTILFSLAESADADTFYCPVDKQVTLRLELFSAPNQTGSLVYDSGDTRFGVPLRRLIPAGRFRVGIDPWGATEPVEAVDALRVLYFDPVRYQSARVTLTSTSSTAAYIEIPYLVIGKRFEPFYGASLGGNLVWKDNIKDERTLGGSLVSTGIPLDWRELKLDLVALSKEERLQLERELKKTKGIGVLIDAYPLDTTELHNNHLFLAKLQRPDMIHKSTDYHSAQLIFTEV